MVTSLSIEDPVWVRGEAAASQLGISRDELYTRAISSYLEEVYAEADGDNPLFLDEALASLALCAPGEPCW